MAFYSHKNDFDLLCCYGFAIKVVCENPVEIKECKNTYLRNTLLDNLIDNRSTFEKLLQLNIYRHNAAGMRDRYR